MSPHELQQAGHCRGFVLFAGGATAWRAAFAGNPVAGPGPLACTAAGECPPFAVYLLLLVYETGNRKLREERS